MEIRRKHGFRLYEGASKGDEPERRPFNEAIESAAVVRIAAAVLKLYRTASGTTGRTSSRDRLLAEGWFDRGVPLTTVRMALVPAERRRQRPQATLPLGPIRTLHYFAPIVAELLAAPSPPEYLDYLLGSPKPGPP